MVIRLITRIANYHISKMAVKNVHLLHICFLIRPYICARLKFLKFTLNVCLCNTSGSLTNTIYVGD